ncbi:hypothetical protein [Micromonospora craniellae]|nr:hypothetical protein [Micromonospora craniellae]
MTAYPVVAPPATTVRGAAAAITKNTTDGIPSRPLARTADTVSGLV